MTKTRDSWEFWLFLSFLFFVLRQVVQYLRFPGSPAVKKTPRQKKKKASKKKSDKSHCRPDQLPIRNRNQLSSWFRPTEATGKDALQPLELSSGCTVSLRFPAFA